MKIIARITLFIFLAFISTPTIITVIEKNADVSLFFSFAEEETHKDIKLVKPVCKQNVVFTFDEDWNTSKSKIFSKNVLDHDNVSGEICSPPPELV